MATEARGAAQPTGLTAAADLSTKQYYAVKPTAARAVNLAGDGERVLGVLQNKPNASGKAADVMCTGETKASAGAAVTAGASVASNAGGQFVPATTGEFIAGFAMTGAAGANEIFTLYLLPGGRAA